MSDAADAHVLPPRSKLQRGLPPTLHMVRFTNLGVISLRFYRELRAKHGFSRVAANQIMIGWVLAHRMHRQVTAAPEMHLAITPIKKDSEKPLDADWPEAL